jgi:hypothetical protein
MKKLYWETIILFVIVLVYAFVLNIQSGYCSDVPYKEVALRIYKIPYSSHTYNCLVKSNLFCEFLKSKGIEAKVIIGYYGKNSFYRHAWIYYFYNKERRIIDLTDRPASWGYREKYYWWLRHD